MPKKKSKYHIRPDGLIELSCTVAGKRKHFYGATDQEAEAKRDAFLAHLEAVPVIEFETVADAWWAEHQKTLSPNTLHGYKVAQERCCEAFGKTDITAITVPDIIAFLQKYAVQGYSQKVINNTRSVLSQIYDYAILSGYLTANPVRSLPIIKGKPKVPRQEAPAQDVEEIEKSKAESLGAIMCYFLLWTGVRRGEAAALQQKHIDRKNHTAQIVQAVAYGDNSRKPILKQPKTASGVRVVEIPDCVMEILPEYDDPETYIFFPEGLPTKTHLEKTLKHYQDAHGITSTAHMLRHSYASNLARAGVDMKTAQSLLGHSSITMTADIYQHVDSENRRKALEKINEYAAGKS